MNRLWVRLSLAFSGVIILTLVIFTLIATLVGPERSSEVRQYEELSAGERRALLRERFPGAVLGTAAIIGLVGIGAGVWISRSLTAPLQALEEAAQALGRRDLGRRVAVEGSQELEAVGQAFNQMASELEQGELLRRNLMADVAHELRTPLTLLQGNLRAILDDVYPLDKEEVARLYDQTRHLSRLVEDLHDLAQAEAHALPLDRREVDLVALVASSCELFAPLADEEGVALSLQVPDAPLLLQADAARLTQALQNLLANALHYTGAGGRVTVSVTRENGTALVTVADNGSGIAPEHLPHVFDRFYRTDSARSRDTGGTGLGLAIARGLVEAHGGTVIATSPGLEQGSAFTVRLPLA
jgi:signal transduction histidine kinase